MTTTQEIYVAIAAEGFSPRVLDMIDSYSNEVLYGTASFSRFNLPEHAGLCTAGAALIGAAVIADYARGCIEASCHAAGGQGGSPSNWQIDEAQERAIEQWAKAAQLWVEDSDVILLRNYGPMIAQGAEAKVYYRTGDTSVVKERASIYSTTQKSLDAIVLHNYLFPETAMNVIGFTRDSDSLFRIILTQPYVRCQRLATKEEIDEMVAAKGFHDNWYGQGVNYASDRMALEDMHPANVFIDDVTGKPICIDCIVKFTIPVTGTSQ